jgi:hypothetical protein
MSTTGCRRIVTATSMLLAGCAQLGAERFADFLPRFQADPAVRAAASGPRIWVTETTLWADTDGYDRQVSCSAVRDMAWVEARGYRLVPTEAEARAAGLVLTTTARARDAMDVSVAPPQSEAQTIYRFHREERTWELVGIEVIRREQPVAAATPQYRCLATE